MMERTLSIIKPDGVSRSLIGEVIRRLENNNLKITAMKMIQMTKEQARGFYAVHKERPFFDSLTDFMTSGSVVVMRLEGENAIARYRELMGATDYKEAADGTSGRILPQISKKMWSTDQIPRKPPTLKSDTSSIASRSPADH